MKYIILLLLLSASLCYNSCSKYEPQYTIIDYQEHQPDYAKDFVCIHHNDIYTANEVLGEKKRLTFTHLKVKTHVVLTPQHDKIAYLDENNAPVIIDSSGAIISQLSQYPNCSDIKWYSNNGNPILLILKDNHILSHNNTINIPPTPFDFVFPNDTIQTFIDAFDINENLDIVFAFRYLRPSGGNYTEYHWGTGINYNGSSIDKYLSHKDYQFPNSLNYDDEKYWFISCLKFRKFPPFSFTSTPASISASFCKVRNKDQSSTDKYVGGSYSVGETWNQVTYRSQSDYTFFQSQNLKKDGHFYGEIIAGNIHIYKYSDRPTQGLPPNISNFELSFGTSTNPPFYFDWEPIIE